VRTEVLRGAIATELATYAQTYDVGLVVMTSHGQGGISRAWLGSVAGALVRRMRVPVLMLRPDAADRLDAPLVRPRNLLVPIDGSRDSARVLGPAAVLGTVWGARLTLLHVLPPTAPRLAGAERADEDAAELELDELAAPLRRRGYVVDVAVVRGESAAKAILDYAAAHAVDAIAMATRGRGGWERVAIGSVADKVLRGALLPLVLFRPPGAGAAEEAAARVSMEPARMLMAG
jgi:nucleotide-binding universal stress UspA family protein